VCNAYLMEGALSKRPFRLGELAHIVGQQASAKSPRGEAAQLDDKARDKAENLMLVCADEHQEIDRDGAVDLFTVNELRRMKATHEDWIRRVTGLRREDTTAVLRVLADVRGRAVELTRANATTAVVRHGQRWPDFPMSFEQDGVEIDLRQLPGEDPVEAAYWQAAIAKIDRGVERLCEGVRDGRARHVSVFAFARLPLLVYLGSRLDDTYGIDVFQRHRSTSGWSWPEPAAQTDFTAAAPLPATVQGHEDAVLVINLSGTIQPDELPRLLHAVPRYDLMPVNATPHPDIISSATSLASFEVATRTLLARIEQSHKHLQRLHVIAAMPVSAAITLGRVRDPHIHPAYVLYDRADDGYHAVLEIR
jgi:SMODS-associated and fused to various effectors sensor domain